MFHTKKFWGATLTGLIIIGMLCSIKSLVHATVNSGGNQIAGGNITIVNSGNYNAFFNFSGTLDVNDIVTTQIIDANSTTLSSTRTGIGGETGIVVNFNASTLTGGTFILSGSIINSGGDLVTGSSVANPTYIIDTQAPTFSGIISGGLYMSGIAIIFTDNNSGVTATLDGDAYNSETPIITGGTHMLLVTDAVGNSNGATFDVDVTPVTGTISYSITGATNQNVVATITFNKTGVTVDNNGGLTGYTFTGNSSFSFIFHDTAGNTGSTSGTVTRIDKTPPIIGTGYIAIGTTGNSGAIIYYNGTIEIRANVSDVGLGFSGDSCQYTTGTNRANALYSGAGNYCYQDGLTPGANITVQFRVADIASNLTTGGAQAYIYDNTPPTTTDNANSTTGNVDVTVTLSRTETGVGISGTLYCVDTLGSCTPTISGASVSVTGIAGAVTHKYVRYSSTDKVSNIEAIKTSAQINIDKELPSLTGTTTVSSNNTSNSGYAKQADIITVLFSSSETLSSTPVLIISGGSLSTGTVTNVGGNNYSGTYTMKSNDVEGIIKFTIRMQDLVTNIGTGTVTSTIIYDRTSPSGISITNPTNTTYFQGGTLKTITWNTGTDTNFSATPIVMDFSDDGFNTIYATIASGVVNNGSYNWTFPTLNTTIARVRIRAYDMAGNIGTFTGNQFVIDSTKPTDVIILYPIGGEYFKGGSGYTITWSGGTDSFLSGKVIEYSLVGTFPGTTFYTDTANTFLYLWTTPNSNSSGVKLRITITDSAGQNSASETATFTIDSTSPTLTFVDTNSNRRNTSTTGTATGSDSLAGLRTTGIVYRTDTGFNDLCDGGTTTPPVFSTDGIYTGYACVRDKAGNVTKASQVYKVDKTAATIAMGTDKLTNTGIRIDTTVNGDISLVSGYLRSKVSGPGICTFSPTTGEDTTGSADTDGIYVIKLTVTDNANNVSSGTLNFIRDTTAPILSGATGVTNTTTSTPSYVFTSNESGTIAYSGSCTSTTTAISGSNSITFSSLANAIYSTCKLKVTDFAGNGSNRLSIPTFTVSYSPPPGGGGGGGATPTCVDTQLICKNGKYEKKTGEFCQGGNLGKSCNLDNCVDGDYSGNPYDGLCKDPTKIESSTGKIVTGIIATKTIVNIPVFSKELTDAYSYAYNLGITTKSSIMLANMTGTVLRDQLAKMMSEFAMKVLDKEPDTTRICKFKDMGDETQEMQHYAMVACQLGLMGLKTDGSPATTFNPKGAVTRAVFGTTLSRTLRGEKYNGGTSRYTPHLEALKANKIITSTGKALDPEIRGYVMLMMLRADKYVVQSPYLDFTSTGRAITTTVIQTTGIISPGSTIGTNTPTDTSIYTTTELRFISTLNKNFQFIAGYKAGVIDIGVKYLQYFLKDAGYYTGTINGINTKATIEALFQWQVANQIVANESDSAAGYLGPNTREVINPLLTTLLNR